jgi:hypothetical protein
MLDGNKLWFWSHTENGKSLWYPSVTTHPRDNVHASWRPQVTAILDKLELLAMKERPTFVFFHVGDDVTLPQQMVNSIREQMPNADIIMCTDENTPIPDEVDSVHVGKYDRSKIMLSRLNAFAVLGLNIPAMYVDSDMVFLKPVDPKEMLGDKDILMCRRSFSKDAIFNPYQRGLDFSEYTGKTLDDVYPILACTTVTKDSSLWARMTVMLRMFISEKFHIWYGDQEVLKYFSSTSGEIGYIDEHDYACLPEYADSHPNAKIIHYKGDRKPK